MDAREYLNRKGVGLDRDPDKPNTLEEKAWERARGSGQQRPNQALRMIGRIGSVSMTILPKVPTP
ncbi:hypothetical protein DK37_14700 [Halomonas sp. SUBG004]|nr:hypothetical protein DK37_14700 [Halomonas sp. SUBG004]